MQVIGINYGKKLKEELLQQQALEETKTDNKTITINSGDTIVEKVPAPENKPNNSHPENKTNNTNLKEVTMNQDSNNTNTAAQNVVIPPAGTAPVNQAPAAAPAAQPQAQAPVPQQAPAAPASAPQEAKKTDDDEDHSWLWWLGGVIVAALGGGVAGYYIGKN